MAIRHRHRPWRWAPLSHNSTGLQPMVAELLTLVVLELGDLPVEVDLGDSSLARFAELIV